MDFKYPTYLLILFLVFSCSENLDIQYYDSGEIKSKVKVNAENIPYGLYEEYYESGTLKISANYSNGKIFDTVQFFHENGLIKEKVLLLNGRKNKWWKI